MRSLLNPGQLLFAVALAVAACPANAQSGDGQEDEIRCLEAIDTVDPANESWAYVVAHALGPIARDHPAGSFLDPEAPIILGRGDALLYCDRRGAPIRLGAPGRYTIGTTGSSTTGVVSARRMDRPISPTLPAPPGRPLSALADDAPPPGQAGIPAYPVWPPEAPSSRVRLDRYIGSRAGLSLYGAGQRLIAAFERAGYLEYSYYAVPGGFALVTRIEQMGPDGEVLEGAERYRLPSDRGGRSLTDVVYELFVNAPPGYYRYIAVIVSDQPFYTTGRTFTDTEAVRRLRRGASDLSAAYRRVRFTDEYRVDALIYEFRRSGSDGSVRMLEPGRLPPGTHLRQTGLGTAIARSFR